MDVNYRLSDFGYEANAEGYQLLYRGKKIGGAGIVGKYKGRKRQEQTLEYVNSAKRDISLIVSGKCPKHYEGAINRINDILVAEVLGGTLSESGLYMLNLPVPKGTVENQVDIKILSAYRTDWQWLMQVVTTIENEHKFHGKEMQFNITKYSATIQTIDDEAIVINPVLFSKYGTYAGTEKIEAVYACVLDYAKWYRLQK